MPFDPWRLIRSAWFWLAVIGVAVILWLFVSRFLGWGDVFCLSDGCQLDRTRAQLERAQSDLSARNEESEGRTAIQREADAAQVVVIETVRTVTEATTQAQGAPDAQTPVGPDRTARARAVRQRLCVAHPESCPGQSADD
jgi:hypothetical protein